jgi:hypothetical protein
VPDQILELEGPDRCTHLGSCAAMEFALGNPPREGLGLVWELLAINKTFPNAYWPAYCMRRSQKKGDLVLKISFCPFCGAALKSIPADRKEASNA